MEIERSPSGSAKAMDTKDHILNPDGLSNTSGEDLLGFVKGEAERQIPKAKDGFGYWEETWGGERWDSLPICRRQIVRWQFRQAGIAQPATGRLD